jgi:O-antigen/teichoic acid export membrane protein
VKYLIPPVNSGKLKSWGKLLTIVASGQVLIQLIGLVSGILIIRLLPTKEYALYTIANTMLGAMTLLADGGISMGVMAQGGKVWQDRQKLGVVVVTGLELRKKFALISLVFTVPILAYLLIHNGASWFVCLLIILALIPAFFAALSDSLLEIAPKLHQDIGSLQTNQIFAALGRIVLITSSLFLFPWTFIAIIGNGIPRMWANIRLRKISNRHADFKQSRDPVIEKQVLSIVKRSLPETIYYCFSGQIYIWLLSFFGSSNSVAQLGALGRLSLALTLFLSLVNTLLVPRFARLASNYKVLLKRFLQVLAGVILLCTGIVLLTYLFPSQILWILGKKYSGLDSYLVLNFIGSCLGLVVGIAFSLYASRGWIINPLFSIPFNIAMLICGALIFKVVTIQGVLLFTIFIGVTQALMHITYAIFKILNLRKDYFHLTGV